MRGVVDLGVELEAVAAQPIGADRGEAVGGRTRGERGAAELLEVGPDRGDGIEVAHPDRLDRAEAGEQGVRARDLELGVAPLAAAVHHLAAVALGDLLVAEAEAEDGHVEVVDRVVVAGILAEGRQRGAAGEDDAAVGREALERVVGLEDLGQHAEPPDLGRDQMGVLAAEIDDGDLVVVHSRSPGWTAGRAPADAARDRILARPRRGYGQVAKALVSVTAGADTPSVLLYCLRTSASTS